MTRSGRDSLPRVMVMARFPAPGAAKARLAPALGEAGAAEVARELGAHALARLRPLDAARDVLVEVHHDGGTPHALRAWLGPWPRFVPQAPGDLGARLAAAFARAFSEGAPVAVAVGADCPAMRASHVRAALQALGDADAVLGPAADGGYWLLGVRREAAEDVPRLLDGVAWGSDRVLAQTLERAAGAGVRAALLEELADVDRPEDLAAWERLRAEEPAAPRSVSVVIPTLQEETHIAAAIASARAAGAAEVIVADGGSADATVAIAEAAGARVVQAERGRGRQMNAGARAAHGDALVFLHADTQLPAGACERVLRALAEPGVLGGAFTFGVDAGCPAPRLVELAGRVRMAVCGVPYGDQALFVRADAFADLGGYREQEVMEDWELARALMRLDGLRMLPEQAVTSGRRWARAGLLRPTLAYLAIIAAYRLGGDPAALDSWRR